GISRLGCMQPTTQCLPPAFTDDNDHARLAIDGEVESGDYPFAVKQRHHEVTPALGLWHVDLEPEVESPKRQRPAAIANQIVEGREEGGPRLERTRLDLLQQVDVFRVYVPVALHPQVHGNNLPFSGELFPHAGQPRVAAPDEMVLHLLGRGYAQGT